MEPDEGRGFEEVVRGWMLSVLPTWKCGGSQSSAFRPKGPAGKNLCSQTRSTSSRGATRPRWDLLALFRAGSSRGGLSSGQAPKSTCPPLRLRARHGGVQEGQVPQRAPAW